MWHRVNSARMKLLRGFHKCHEERRLFLSRVVLYLAYEQVGGTGWKVLYVGSVFFGHLKISLLVTWQDASVALKGCSQVSL